MKVYAVQSFQHGKWTSFFATTNDHDASKLYRVASGMNLLRPLRLVSFTVADLDFLATHCTDFAVHDA